MANILIKVVVSGQPQYVEMSEPIVSNLIRDKITKHNLIESNIIKHSLIESNIIKHNLI